MADEEVQDLAGGYNLASSPLPPRNFQYRQTNYSSVYVLRKILQKL